MQFTPQQLAGGPKFSAVTRIGNWQEELALEEAKVNNFQTRSSNGNLALRKMERKITICSEIVPHTFSEDGIIRFGDTVILRHDNTGSVLACDPFDEIIAGQSKFLVSTVSEEPEPKARNVFRIVRPPPHMCNFDDNLNDPVVHIGQSFMLACSESLLIQAGSKLLAPTLYLSSTKKNERMATKRTNRQLVYMSPVVNAESVWLTVVPSKGRSNASGRFLAMGQPLSVRDSLQITHRQTNMYLTCDPREKTSTEFGIELECFADRSTMPGKLGLVVSEFQGLSTSQTLSKPDAPIFAWHFVASNDRRAAAETRVLPPAATQETILAEVREAIRARGVDAFWNLRDFFKQFEKRMLSTGKIDREDLKSCLLDWGVQIPFHYLDTIVDLCDSKRVGLIDLNEFLDVLRGPLNNRREGLLRDVYDALDKRHERVVSMDEVKNNFRGDGHPLVTIGGLTPQDALNHLLKYFEVRDKLPPKVTYEKFRDYYADLSATIDDDYYFEDVLRSNWAGVL
jgi:Ca2+-binding EF-hand superfamily protein